MRQGYVYVTSNKISFAVPPDIRHPEELSLLRKPRDPKKKKKKLEDAEEDDLELEGPLLTPGSGELMDSNSTWRENRERRIYFFSNKRQI